MRDEAGKSPAPRSAVSAITVAWIHALLVAASTRPAQRSTSIHATDADPLAFAMLSLLHGHDAVHVGVSASAIEAMLADPFHASGFHAKASVLPKPLADLASRLVGTRLDVRRGGMRLGGNNPFALAFVPPAASALPGLLSTLERESGNARKTLANGDVEAVLRLAYAEYFALLAIHPLPDANGRTARRLFAARLWHAGATDARALLAIVLSFAGRGSRFHLAAQLARAGEFAELFANWRDANAAADRWFAASLRDLSSACTRKDAAAIATALQSIRQLLLVAIVQL